MTDARPIFVIRAPRPINSIVAGVQFKRGVGRTADAKAANACASLGHTVTNPHTGLTVKGPPVGKGRL